MMKKKVLKTSLIIISVVIALVVLVILFISPITKYLIEKYDEKYTGRQITLGLTYVNPFTGYLHFSNLKIMESKSDSVFFSANGLGINIALFKLFSKTYEITELTVDKPRGTVIQNKNVFNYSDLITKFTSKENPDTLKPPLHFNILNIKITDGEFYYLENLIPINYFIKNTVIESSGMKWDSDTLTANFSFIPGIGNGDIKGTLSINLKTLDYRFAAVVHKFDLQIIGQYLKELTNYGHFTANLDADIKASGNFNDEENITTTGMMAINQFHYGKTATDDYASFEKLLVTIDELSPKNHKYLFDTISLSHPYFKYEIYDSLDNLQTMFGKDGSNIDAAKADPQQFNLVIEIANYVKVLSRNFFQSNYKVNRLAILNGDVKYNDYSLREKFSMALNPLTVHADSIDKKHNRVNIAVRSGIQPYGNLDVTLSINPKDSSDFDLNFQLKKMSLALFNPYAVSYTSFPLDRGTVELFAKWNVHNGEIKSENHIVIIDPRLATRIKNKDTKWIPMRLVFFFVRERGNVVDYQVPISGNLSDPKFHLRDVIFDALKNTFVKPVTTPYRTEVKTIETEIEKSLTLKWEMRNSFLQPNQKKFIEKMATFLKKNGDATITVFPEIYAVNEKEYILFYEAKKKYYLDVNKMQAKDFGEKDSVTVSKMSVKDSSFVHYIFRNVPDSMLFTMQERCYKLIDSASVNLKFKQLNTDRENTFLSYFKNEDVEKQIHFAKNENVIPYNGFSFYKIDYDGEYPKSLLKAYEKIEELNNEAPRKKFKKDRVENKNAH